ncbi:SPFH domain-containing protein [Streptomonospora salina]|uniref:Putative membrane protein YqiK n=1 Tax=Streptomonospora salina TaxID=104205 RepID=A0A841EF33_9ACTN|nr:SPFH domain-containing protein [Streptomonospora salina]MBB5999030.1 putative membrane protein YqiK [Streptomonospora salina]
MDSSTITTGAGVLLAVALLVVVGLVLTISRLFRKVEQGKALIVSKVRKVDVTFTGAVVLPVLHRAEVMDISVKTMELERNGTDGLICKDNIRADISIKFFVRVNPTTDDVLRVAKLIGVDNASSQDKLQDLFSAKFSEALKTVGKHFEFEDLYTRRAEFRDRIMEVIGQDLNGYVLDDAAIDYLEQTPKGRLDTDNILDAQGILKITEQTKPKNERTHLLEQDEAKEKDRQTTESMEAREELRRRREEAESKAAREIATLQAREEAETERVQAEERLKAQTARIRTDEQLGVQNQNQQREIAVAEKNRERVISIEGERIEKDRMLEVVGRDRETELARIAKDKEVEGEKREVADVVRERVAVDKTVAEQEENIKKLRAVEEAERQRQATVIQAEAEAQENLVKDIKAAEAAEQSAKHRANEELTLAESRQQASELDTRAKIRHAEGLQAESAAEGLAAVQVREQDAEAVEKVGRAEASVEREKAKAQAEGAREKLRAEAEGLNDKAGAMAALDEVGREHEEYRLRLETEKDVRMAGIDVHRQVAEAQASVLASGLDKADINIVGGDGMFFDRMVNSIGMGKAVDGFVDNSDVARNLGGSWLEGSQDFARDLSRALGEVGTDGIKNLTISAVLMRLIDSGGPNTEQLRELLSTAKRLGVDEAPVSALDSANPDGAKAKR